MSCDAYHVSALYILWDTWYMCMHTTIGDSTHEVSGFTVLCVQSYERWSLHCICYPASQWMGRVPRVRPALMHILPHSIRMSSCSSSDSHVECRWLPERSRRRYCGKCEWSILPLLCHVFLSTDVRHR